MDKIVSSVLTLASSKAQYVLRVFGTSRGWIFVPLLALGVIGISAAAASLGSRGIRPLEGPTPVPTETPVAELVCKPGSVEASGTGDGFIPGEGSPTPEAAIRAHLNYWTPGVADGNVTLDDVDDGKGEFTIWKNDRPIVRGDVVLFQNEWFVTGWHGCSPPE